MYYIQTQKYKNRVHGKYLGIAIPHQSPESVPKCRFGRQLPPGGSDWALPRQCVYQHFAVWLTKADNLDQSLYYRIISPFSTASKRVSPL